MLSKENFPRPTPKQCVEALLFSSSVPLPLSKIAEILQEDFSLNKKEIATLLRELQKEYTEQERAFAIEESGEGYILQTRRIFSDLLDRHHGRKKERLSLAAHEVLAIVAYRQPITRLEIDGIRGVDSTGTLAQLIQKELVVASGKRDAPGRPMEYKTTNQFLLRFGLRSLNDLP